MGALLLCLALALGAPARDVPVEQAEPVVEESVRRADASGDLGGSEARLEHWRSLTDEERARLKERFEALRALSPEQRQALEQRARDLKAQREELRQGLDPELRAHLDRLPAWERDRVLREEQLSNCKDRGRSLRGSLPAEHRRWLEDLVRSTGPEGPDAIGRPRPFGDKREHIRGRFGSRAIEHLTAEGHLSAQQAERLEGLEGKARMVEFFRIEREQLEARVAANGLPEGVDEAAWQELSNEASAERFMHRAKRLGLALFWPPPDRPGHMGRSESRGPFGGPGLPEGAPAWASELLEGLRPTLAERLELRTLPRAEHRAAQDLRAAARLRALLPKLEGFDPERAAALAELSDAELVRAADELLEQEVFGGKRPERHGRPGRSGPSGPQGLDRPDRPGRPRSVEGPKGHRPRR